MKSRVCIVDDEKNVRLFLRDLLEQEGYEICEAADGGGALKAVRSGKPHIIILDLNLPDGNGIDLIAPLKNASPFSQVIVITALGTVANAVDSMKRGAFDFITKPFEVDSILISIRRAIDFVSVSSENEALRKQQKNHIFYEDFIGASPEVARIKNLILKLVHTDVPILITGETGTGKNVLAKQIHFTLSEPQAPIVYTNCSSVPDTLFESELFGHEKGSFTGAQNQKRGRVEEADGGTLILDEISEIPYDIQAKLLVFLQERTFYRIGGTRPISINARIIAISNRNLQEEIEKGLFRKDLFYRLNLIHFQIPPLRKRPEDIPLLVDYFIDVLKRKYGLDRKEISPSCLEYFRTHPWPGNVREMKNVLERSFICCENDLITDADVDHHLGQDDAEAVKLKDRLRECERRFIIESLARHNGNRAQTAEDLGISIRNLQYKLGEYDIGG